MNATQQLSKNEEIVIYVITALVVTGLLLLVVAVTPLTIGSPWVTGIIAVVVVRLVLDIRKTVRK